MQGRLADSNRNLGVRALLLLGALGRAMGPAVERAARQCLAPALACLADKKKPVRGLHWQGRRAGRSCCLLVVLSCPCSKHVRGCTQPWPNIEAAPPGSTLA